MYLRLKTKRSSALTNYAFGGIVMANSNNAQNVAPSLDLTRMYGLDTACLNSCVENCMAPLERAAGYNLTMDQNNQLGGQMMMQDYSMQVEREGATRGNGLPSTPGENELIGVPGLVQSEQSMPSQLMPSLPPERMPQMGTPYIAREQNPEPASMLGSMAGPNGPVNAPSLGSMPGTIPNDVNSMEGFLRAQVGKRVAVQFLLGMSTISEKTGTIIAVGNNYLLIKDVCTNEVVLCNIDDIKFIRFL